MHVRVCVCVFGRARARACVCVCVCARTCMPVPVQPVSIRLSVCPRQLCEKYLVDTLDTETTRIKAAQTYRLDDLSI